MKLMLGEIKFFYIWLLNIRYNHTIEHIKINALYFKNMCFNINKNESIPRDLILNFIIKYENDKT